VIFVGKEFKNVHGAYTWFEHSQDAAAYIATHRPAHSAILLKGSRGSKMEVLLDALER
jgi:UDP-N-acetylmuramoyl-tripeptide--D-alanyl-D-alanine ligase